MAERSNLVWFIQDDLLEAVSIVGAARGQIRRVMRRSPELYTLVGWFRRARGLDARLPQRDTKICVEGYPSTGNTLATFVITHCWPSISLDDIASHRHCAAVVKSAVRKGIPTIVLIRGPVEAITSKVVRFGGAPEAAADDYIDFYGAVARAMRRGASIAVIEFDTLINHTEDFARAAARLTGQFLDLTVVDAVKNEFGHQVRESLTDLDRPPSEWALPHPEKDRLKREVAFQFAVDRNRVEMAERAHAEVLHLAGLDGSVAG